MKQSKARVEELRKVKSTYKREVHFLHKWFIYRICCHQCFITKGIQESWGRFQYSHTQDQRSTVKLTTYPKLEKHKCDSAHYGAGKWLNSLSSRPAKHREYLMPRFQWYSQDEHSGMPKGHLPAQITKPGRYFLLPLLRLNMVSWEACLV